MRSRAKLSAILSVLFSLQVLSAPHWAVAQDEDSDAEPVRRVPIVVVAAASVDRLLDDMGALFEVAERLDVFDAANGLLENVGNLEGMNRQKPFGVMLFLKPGLTPQPAPVGFVPYDNLDALLRTIERGPITTKPSDDREGWYEVTGPRRTLFVREVDGYAFVSAEEDILDGELPSPAEVTRQLTARYDVAATVDVAAVPEGMRDLFLTFLQTSAGVELQRRDDEPAARHALRKANGESTLEFIEQLLTQGEKLTLGVDVDEIARKAVIAGDIRARKDSKLAGYLQNIGSRPSRFANVLTRPVPLTFGMSWKLAPREQKVLTELFGLAEAELGRQLNSGSDDPAQPSAPNDGAAARLIGPLKATAENGHVDFFAQFVGQPPAKFVLVGGMAVAEADAFGQALQEILNRVKDSPQLADLQLNVDVHQGIAFHRLQGKEIRRQDERLYGDKPGLYLGSGQNTVWFAVGGEEALPELKKAIDAVAEGRTETTAPDPSAPFQIVMHMANWIGMGAEDANNPRPRQQLAREAFAKGNDRLRIDVQPTETGARLRVEFEEGFLRFVGLGIAYRFDRGQ